MAIHLHKILNSVEWGPRSSICNPRNAGLCEVRTRPVLIAQLLAKIRHRVVIGPDFTIRSLDSLVF
jgi:hypothetical protein